MKAKQATLFPKGKCLVRHKRSEAVFLLSSHRVAQELSRGDKWMAYEIFLPTELRGQGAEALEDMENRDFGMGAKYGNEVAAKMARRTNVY